MRKRLNLSVIIPAFNEEKNIKILYTELNKVLSNLDKTYEIIFVDDGSTDKSFEIMKNLAKRDKHVKVIKLMSNYGQSSAIAAGTEFAAGENIVTMDSDLQHDSRDIPLLLKKLEEGYHVVCGWRKTRAKSDSFIKKTIPSILSNFLIRKFTKTNLHDSTGGMRAFKKTVTDNIPIYGEMHIYLPVLAIWKGFKVTEIPIHLRSRKYGKTKYNFSRLFRGFMDLLTITFFTSYSTRPLHIFGSFGISLFIFGFLISFYLLMRLILAGISMMTDIPLVSLSILLIILGANFFCFGLMADMISFDAIASGRRKVYLIDKAVKH